MAMGLALFSTTIVAQDQRVGDVDPVMPSEKVERALNGTMDFPPSPVVAWALDEKGFAKDRLFHVPPAGEHPRILFAAEDLPRLRKEMASNEAGKRRSLPCAIKWPKGSGIPLRGKGNATRRCSQGIQGNSRWLTRRAPWTTRLLELV